MSDRPRILIVDDDHYSLDLLEIVLYREYDIITAANGFEALAKIKEGTPAAVMTDIMMPVMDGIRLFNSLRRDEMTKRIPVVAVTAFSGHYPEKSLVNMGFAAVVAKPVEGKAVRALMADLVRKIAR